MHTSTVVLECNKTDVCITSNDIDGSIVLWQSMSLFYLGTGPIPEWPAMVWFRCCLKILIFWPLWNSSKLPRNLSLFLVRENVNYNFLAIIFFIKVFLRETEPSRKGVKIGCFFFKLENSHAIIWKKDFENIFTKFILWIFANFKLCTTVL